MRAVALVLILLFAGCTAKVDDAPEPTEAPREPRLCEVCEQVFDAGPERDIEPHISANPNDPLHWVAGAAQMVGTEADGGPVALRYFVTHDGGETVTARDWPGPLEPGNLLAAYNVWADPGTLILQDGTVLYSAMAGTGIAFPLDQPAAAFTSFDIVVGRSSDGGNTWGEASIVSPGVGVLSLESAGFYNDQPFMSQAPDGTIVMGWARIVSEGAGGSLALVGVNQVGEATSFLKRFDLYAATSTDSGATWSEPSVLREGGLMHRARTAVAPDGTLIVAASDLADWKEGNQIHIATSSDNGNTWQVESPPDMRSGRAAYPVATDAGMYVLTNPMRDDQISEVTLWHKSATGWDSRVLDSGTAAGSVTPALIATENGTLYATWQRANAGGNEYVAWAMSPSGPEVMHTINSTAIMSNHDVGVIDWPALGDYQGLAPIGNDAVALWVTGEAPNTDLAFARLSLFD